MPPHPPAIDVRAATPVLEALSAPQACPACGAEEMREFCARCGERRLDEEAHSLRRFLADALDALTNVDSRFGRTFALLLTRPGRLSAEHFEGVRRPFLGPLQLFLLCNVVFFFVQGIASTGFFSVSLENALAYFGGVFQGFTARDGLSFRELAQDRQAFAAYGAEFRGAADAHARSLVILLVPGFAAAGHALFGRSRRYYAQHLVFALHFHAFVMVFMSAAALLVHLGLYGLISAGAMAHAAALERSANTVLPLLIVGVFWGYLAEAGRRAFGEGVLRALAKATLLMLAWFGLLALYRSVLFLVTVVLL